MLHEEITHRIKRDRISEYLLSLFIDFLRNRKPGVILNDQSSSWANINAGVPKKFHIRSAFVPKAKPRGRHQKK